MTHLGTARIENGYVRMSLARRDTKSAQGVSRIAVAAAILACALSGCVQNQTIPAGQSAPLKADLETGSSLLVAGRFLLVPVGIAVDKFDSAFSAGSYKFSPSSWFGVRIGKEYETHRWLNLLVLDLDDNRRDAVFDRQVALGGWRWSFVDRDVLRFSGLLVLTARAADTDGNKQIDHEDEVHAFAYDLAAHSLRQLTPDGYSLLEITPRGDDRLVFTVQRRNEVSIFEVNVWTGAQRLVLKDVRP